MKNKTEPATAVIYPFDSFHQAYRCTKCKRLLRYSGVHNKVYVVSELQTSEILHKNHNCFKTNDKGAKVASDRGIR